ncbi:MAG TPA: hypothetical protein VL651_10885 [Bacteroidia bacterium]|jgi:hypothetical protein|nr:hypothetical protein [Bacteroidia bacterium]
MRKTIPILLLLLIAASCYYFFFYGKKRHVIEQDLINEKVWRVDKLFCGEEKQVDTKNEVVFPNGLWFFSNHVVQVPGIYGNHGSTRSAKGKWYLQHDSLHIRELDTLGNIYEGDYEVNVDTVQHKLRLVSSGTIIDCSRYSLLPGGSDQ